MAWILRCLLWITLMYTSAHRYNPYFPSIYPTYYDYPSYYDDSQEYTRPAALIRRLDHVNHERMHERSAERTYKSPVHRNTGVHQRTNDRSISVNSGIQRVQEQERKRLQSRVDDSIPRIENGSYKIVNKFPKPQSSVINRHGQMESGQLISQDSVVFPGPTSRSSQQYVPEVPEECKNVGICEDVPNYPTNLVSSIIEQLGDDKKQFQIDELDMPEIAQRIGPPDEIELCTFTHKIVIPKAAPDKDGKWFYIVNERDKPLQGFHVEICSGQKSCSKLAYFPLGYESTCKQKYSFRDMTALDENGNTINKPFKVPSCCSCVIRQVE